MLLVNCVLKGILQRNYRKMTMKWTFSYHFFVNMRGSMNFLLGVSRTICPDRVFWGAFLVFNLFYRIQWFISKKTIIFQGGPAFSRGVQLFPVRSNCLFPIETHITYDFPGGVGTPCPPPPLDPGKVKLHG